jgi:hypothetical protein
MYLYGSLALGDFDPHRSDIDFLVVTATEIPDDLFQALQDMHAQFDAGGSPWAAKIEAAYIPQAALRHSTPTATRYPQIETGRTLVREPLEIGWAFQRHSLREHGIALAGPDPHTLVEPVDPDDMRRAAVAIAGGWLEEAQHDPEWLAWLGERSAQAFVVLTLCRLLYSLDSGRVASKPAAARWAQKLVPPHWAALIERTLAGPRDHGETAQRDIHETIALLKYTVEQSHSPH